MKYRKLRLFFSRERERERERERGVSPWLSFVEYRSCASCSSDLALARHPATESRALEENAWLGVETVPHQVAYSWERWKFFGRRVDVVGAGALAFRPIRRQDRLLHRLLVRESTALLQILFLAILYGWFFYNTSFDVSLTALSQVLGHRVFAIR